MITSWVATRVWRIFAHLVNQQPFEEFNRLIFVDDASAGDGLVLFYAHAPEHEIVGHGITSRDHLIYTRRCVFNSGYRFSLGWD
jgi:hypothetical protein